MVADEKAATDRGALCLAEVISESEAESPRISSCVAHSLSRSRRTGTALLVQITSYRPEHAVFMRGKEKQRRTNFSSTCFPF